MKHRWIALTAALAMAAAAIPALPVQAAEPMQTVVIGDNLAHMTGMAAEAYSENASVAMKYTYFTADQAHTEDVLAMLGTAEVKAALEKADFVIFSAGLYDIMDPYIVQATDYRIQFGFKYFSDIFGAHMSDFGITDEDELKGYCNTLGRCARTNKKTVGPNVLSIGEQLKSATKGEIIAVNCYNPMDLIEVYPDLTAKRQLAYDLASNPVMGMFKEYVNPYYTQLAEEQNMTVIDAFESFAKKAYLYSYPEELEPSPSLEGSLLLGEKVGAAMGLKTSGMPAAMLGDVDGDANVSASDAALVLIHSASVGSGGSGTFTSLQKLTGNVSRDITTNATDAARILIYAAIQGAEGSADFGRIG